MDSTLETLAQQVTAMKTVFDESNVARERHREFLDRRHAHTLASVDALRLEIAAESQRFEETLAAFVRRGQTELNEARESLSDDLKNAFTKLAGRLAELDARQNELDKSIQREISDRKSQTARLVEDMQTAMKRLDEALAKEIDRRTSDVKKLTKALEDNAEAWTRQVENEKLDRELAVGKLAAQVDADVGRAHRRQQQLTNWAGEFFRQLEYAVAKEAKLRGATESSIVESVTRFVEKFKLNLDREVKL